MRPQVLTTNLSIEQVRMLERQMPPLTLVEARTERDRQYTIFVVIVEWPCGDSYARSEGRNTVLSYAVAEATDRWVDWVTERAVADPAFIAASHDYSDPCHTTVKAGVMALTGEARDRIYHMAAAAIPGGAHAAEMEDWILAVRHDLEPVLRELPYGKIMGLIEEAEREQRLRDVHSA